MEENNTPDIFAIKPETIWLPQEITDGAKAVKKAQNMIADHLFNDKKGETKEKSMTPETWGKWRTELEKLKKTDHIIIINMGYKDLRMREIKGPHDENWMVEVPSPLTRLRVFLEARLAWYKKTDQQRQQSSDEEWTAHHINSAATWDNHVIFAKYKSVEDQIGNITVIPYDPSVCIRATGQSECSIPVGMDMIKIKKIPEINEYVCVKIPKQGARSKLEEDGLGRIITPPPENYTQKYYRQWDKDMEGDCEDPDKGDKGAICKEELNEIKRRLKWKNTDITPFGAVELYVDYQAKEGGGKKMWVSLEHITTPTEGELTDMNDQKEKLEQAAAAEKAAAEKAAAEKAEAQQEEQQGAAGAEGEEDEDKVEPDEDKVEADEADEVDVVDEDKVEAPEPVVAEEDEEEEQDETEEKFIKYESSIFSISKEYEEGEIAKALENAKQMRQDENELAALMEKNQQSRQELEALEVALNEAEVAGNTIEKLNLEKKKLEKEKEKQIAENNELELLKKQQEKAHKEALNKAMQENKEWDKQSELLLLEKKKKQMKKKSEKDDEDKDKEEERKANVRHEVEIQKIITILDRKYDNLKNNIYCKKIFMDIFVKACEYMEKRADGPPPVPLDDIVNSIKGEKRAEHSGVKNYDIFVNAVECIAMLYNHVYPRKHNAPDTFEYIKTETKFNDFVDYFKAKEIKNHENDCILNKKTQPIPPSGKEMYGGSSYKRTPKKHRKRN